jgi:GntR family transcriptional regulator
MPDTVERAAQKNGKRRGLGRKPPAEPRYVTVANALTKAIDQGRYPVGSTLPTEHELCDKFGISRFTAREALRQLLDAGLVVRRPRAGTTVIATQRRSPFTQTLGSLNDLLQYAADTELRLLYTGTIEVDPDLARDISVGVGERWLFSIGMRFKKDDNLPVCITRVYINPAFSDLARALANRTGTIYRLIEQRHGVTVGRVEQKILAVSLSRDDAAHLKAKAKSPALRTIRLYYDTAGRLLEVSDSVHPGQRFSYSMTITKSA